MNELFLSRWNGGAVEGRKDGVSVFCSADRDIMDQLSLHLLSALPAYNVSLNIVYMFSEFYLIVSETIHSQLLWLAQSNFHYLNSELILHLRVLPIMLHSPGSLNLWPVPESNTQ